MPVLMMLPTFLSGFSMMSTTRPDSICTTPYLEGISESVTSMARPPLCFRRSEITWASMMLSPATMMKSSFIWSRTAKAAWAVPRCFSWMA